MKYLKMLGLAAIAAMALAAFGAGSASATVLCSTETNPCTGTKYGAGTAIEAGLKVGTVSTLTNSITNVTCTKSTVAGKTTTAGGSGTTVTGEGTIKFEGCQTASGTACTVTETKGPWHWELHYTSAGDLVWTIRKGAGNEDPGTTVVCGSLINCKFTTALASLNVHGGAPATATANKLALSRSGGLCPSEASWDAEYTISKPNPLYAAAS